MSDGKSNAGGMGVQGTNSEHDAHGNLTVALHVELLDASQRNNQQYHVLCNCRTRVGICESRSVQAFPTNIPVPIVGNGSAAEDGEEEDDYGIDDNVRQGDQAGNLCSPECEDLEVEHTERDFDET